MTLLIATAMGVWDTILLITGWVLWLGHYVDLVRVFIVLFKCLKTRWWYFLEEESAQVTVGDEALARCTWLCWHQVHICILVRWRLWSHIILSCCMLCINILVSPGIGIFALLGHTLVLVLRCILSRKTIWRNEDRVTYLIANLILLLEILYFLAKFRRSDQTRSWLGILLICLVAE